MHNYAKVIIKILQKKPQFLGEIFIGIFWISTNRAVVGCIQCILNEVFAWILYSNNVSRSTCEMNSL